MKKTGKKILVSLITFVMLLTMVPMMGITATAAMPSGTCGEKLTWIFNTTTGELKIDGTGAMYDYPLTDSPWETYEANIKSVVVGNGVTTIGEYVFDQCGSIKSVIIGNSITVIGVGAFRNCDNLKSVTFGNSVTTISRAAFYDCDSLTSVTIPKSVTSIQNAFESCDSLTTFEVDAENKYYISDSSGVLYNRNKTELIKYPIGNPRTSFTIPDSVTAIGEDAFSNSTNLISVTIPDSVSKIGEYAFNNCSNLTSVTIPDGVTMIGERTFGYCTSLKSVTIPDSVTTIENGVFIVCSDLTDVYYGGSEIEWDKVEIGEDNIVLNRATIHFKTTDSNAVGDPNNDGKINSTDALVCLQHSVGKTKLTGTAFTAGDVDKNGTINSTDALKILQYSVGKIEKL